MSFEPRMLWSASAVSASEGSVSVSDAPERADVAPGRNRGVSTHAPPRRLGSVAGRRALMALMVRASSRQDGSGGMIHSRSAGDAHQ